MKIKNLFPTFFKKSKIKDNYFLALDIGTEAVKVLIFSIETVELTKENRKIIIFGGCSQYFERYGVFDGKNFETDVIKTTILKAIKGAEEFAAERLGFSGTGLRRLPALVSLPANILKARITWQSFNRRNLSDLKISEAEEKNIYQQVFKEIPKKISQEFAEEFGILANDIQWINLKILEIKIDGYSVSKLQGYEGKDLELQALSTFLPKYYFENINRIFKDLKLEVFKIVHTAEILPVICQDAKKDGIFLDVGGEVSQIILTKDGKLEQVNELEKGGRVFSQRLADTFGIDEASARILKERYSNKLLSAGATNRIREILSEESRSWYESLKLKIKKISPLKLLPSTIFIFGGGSLLPEIKEVLQSYNQPFISEEPMAAEGFKGLPVYSSATVKFIDQKDLPDIEDTTKSLTSPKDIPTLLISYYA